MASKFCKLGAAITGSEGLSYNTQLKQFKHHFGVNPHVCTVIMDRIKQEFNFVVYRMYLLWSLCFLCCYPKVKVIRKMFGVDVKTFRKHAGKIICCIKNLKVVSNRVLHVNYCH